MKTIMLDKVLPVVAGASLLICAGCASFDRSIAQANSGNAKAQYRVGYTYVHGDKQVSRDLKKGMDWLEKSAQGGYSPAMLELGNIYLTDKIVLNPAKGVEWFKKAKAAGNASANRQMGLALLNGEFTEFNSEMVPALQEAVEGGGMLSDHTLADAYALHFRGYIQKLANANRTAEVNDFFQLVRDFTIRMKGGTVTSRYPSVKAIDVQINEWEYTHPKK